MYDRIGRQNFEKINQSKSSASGTNSRKSRGNDRSNKSKKGSNRAQEYQASPFGNKYGVDLRLCKSSHSSSSFLLRK